MSEISLAAILFDLDGILIDSEPAYAEIFRRWLWEHDVSFAQQDVIMHTIQPGITWGDCIHIAASVTQQRIDPRKAQREIFDRVEHYILDVGLPLKPGARAALDTLAQHYQLAVVSSSPKKVIERALRHHALHDYFTAITALEDVQYPKPHPQPYQHTLQTLQLKPEQAVALEDSFSGAQSAAAASVFVYVWPDPAFPAEQFANFGKVVYSFDDVIKDLT